MTTGQILGGGAGAVIGGVLAAPTGGMSIAAGAALGFNIGMAAGGYLDPPNGPTVYGPRLNDLSWQQSAYGANIPRIYGTVALSGNVVWLEHNKLKEVVKKKKSGGKGGGGGTVTKTYTYFATFALMLCQGEVAGVRRIWCGDKLIYNAGSDDLETIIASNQAAKGWKLYTGKDDQLPDPRYEADVGVGNAPAFRGYTYIAFYDFALKDYSNTLQAAQFKVELVRSASYGISKISSDAISATGNHELMVSSLGGGGRKICANSGTNAWYEDGVRTSFSIYTGSVIKKTSISGPGYLSCKSYQSSIDNPLFQNNSTFMVTDGNRLWPMPALINNNTIQLNGGSLYGFNDSGVYRGGINDGVNSVSISGVGAIKVHKGELLVFRASEVRRYALSDLSFISSSVCAISSISSLLVAGEDGDIYFSNSQSLTSISKLSDDLSEVVSTFMLPIINNDSFSTQFNVVDGVLHRGWTNALAVNQIFHDAFNLHDMVIGAEYLSDVLHNEVSLSSLINSEDLDASLITQEINGYRVSGGTIRSVIDPLQGAYPFDVVASGYKIKFVPRGQVPVVTIPWEDLAAANGDEIGDSLPYSREMDSQLPQKVTITSLSATREYGSATQSYERMNTSAVNVEQRDIPLVLSDDEIAQMAEKLLFLRWLERDDFSFSLPPTYLALEPADVVTVQAKFGTFELRITEINYEADGRLTCKAKANSAPLYTSRAVGAPGPGPAGTIPLPGESVFVPLDIPVIDETLQNATGFVGVMTGYTDGWPGAVAVRSPDGGQTWSDLQAFEGKATLGTARNALGSNACTVIDQSSLLIDMISGEFESITREQLLNGVNFAAYGKDGRWEIVRFQNATLQSDGSYLLSGFVRGDRGTEWAAGLHQAGDWFVLLDDPDNAFIGMAVASIGAPATYRGVTSGASIDAANDVPFTYKGVNLECLSPVSARGLRDSSGNFSSTFTRRSRLSSSWWSTGVPAPIGETSEAYDIDVMAGATVKRTITATSPAFVYSAADQVSDFGSAQASITFRIYQRSETVARGYPLEVTL